VGRRVPSTPGGSRCRTPADLGRARVQIPPRSQDSYGVAVSLADVLDLDSSTDRKFSRHVIVVMPDGSRFRDNQDAGRVRAGRGQRCRDGPREPRRGWRAAACDRSPCR